MAHRPDLAPISPTCHYAVNIEGKKMYASLGLKTLKGGENMKKKLCLFVKRWAFVHTCRIFPDGALTAGSTNVVSIFPTPMYIQ